MRRIRLGRSRHYAVVDDCDYDYLAGWKWHVVAGYAARTIRKNGVYKGIILMHRVVAKSPRGVCTDHKNRNRLDNRRENLRHATHGVNMQNRVCAGVSWSKSQANHSSKAWVARIGINGKSLFLGYYKTGPEARAAYLKAKRKHHAPFVGR